MVNISLRSKVLPLYQDFVFLGFNRIAKTWSLVTEPIKEIVAQWSSAFQNEPRRINLRSADMSSAYQEAYTKGKSYSLTTWTYINDRERFIWLSQLYWRSSQNPSGTYCATENLAIFLLKECMNTKVHETLWFYVSIDDRDHDRKSDRRLQNVKWCWWKRQASWRRQ